MIAEIAKAAGTSERDAQMWLDHVSEMTVDRQKTHPGEPIETSILWAIDQRHNLLAELLAGTTARARVARAYMAADAYYRLGGHADHHQRTVASVLENPDLADLRVDNYIERVIDSMMMDRA